MRSVTRNPPRFFPPRLLAGMGLHPKLCCTYCPCGVLARDWRKAKGLWAAAQPRCFGQHDKAVFRGLALGGCAGRDLHDQEGWRQHVRAEQGRWGLGIWEGIPINS